MDNLDIGKVYASSTKQRTIDFLMKELYFTEKEAEEVFNHIKKVAPKQR